jgi:hypothetical protein
LSGAVDCRIQVSEGDDVRTVSVAGRLGDAHIPDLMIACGEISPALHVDLTDVVSADAIAIEALGRLRNAGARIIGVPKYIELKLDSLSPQPRGHQRER